MADDLINANSQLKKTHTNVINEIIELMSVNLLKDKEKWTDKMNQIKDMVSREIKGRVAKECNIWIMHLNYQLYKSLEF